VCVVSHMQEVYDVLYKRRWRGGVLVAYYNEITLRHESMLSVHAVDRTTGFARRVISQPFRQPAVYAQRSTWRVECAVHTREVTGRTNVRRGDDRSTSTTASMRSGHRSG